ncbi:ATPase inhibitor, mitochondrial [Mizuhopecten yessoensis]|uniref:ATP synthase F1 subunit epsilon n=1 Tax=Mizuhopecten yessoensis TaxID=6573 RepID=A0A210QZS1_MIZYE|nr:ATPase inhibitor, mitochondrial [Mizuhopecten yessoensis]
MSFYTQILIFYINYSIINGYISNHIMDTFETEIISLFFSVRAMSTGDAGSGAGKGGGSGGSIRDAGGSFGKMEAAHEEQFMRKLAQEQLKKLKEHHEDEIKQHEDAIKRHKANIKKLKPDAGSDSDSD